VSVNFPSLPTSNILSYSSGGQSHTAIRNPNTGAISDTNNEASQCNTVFSISSSQVTTPTNLFWSAIEFSNSDCSYSADSLQFSSTTPGGCVSFGSGYMTITCDTATSYTLKVSSSSCAITQASGQGHQGVCLSVGTSNSPTSLIVRCAASQTAALQATSADLQASQHSAASSSSSSSFSGALLIGTIVGGVVGVALLIYISYYFYRKKRRTDQVAPSSIHYQPHTQI
jgi:hypothetical protein